MNNNQIIAIGQPLSEGKGFKGGRNKKPLTPAPPSPKGQSGSIDCFQGWTTIFPGKGGLSWKRGWDGIGTKEEAEAIASKNCNVIAVPFQLFEHIKEMERKVVENG